MKTTSALMIMLISALAAAALAGCAAETPQNEPAAASFEGGEPGSVPPSDLAEDIGQGGTVFAFTATDDTGKTSFWNVYTDEKTVGAALQGVGLIEGDAGEFGLMVTHVNGLRADYDKDGAYWAFYIDGEFAMTGADSTEIEQGKDYAFVYTAA